MYKEVQVDNVDSFQLDGCYYVLDGTLGLHVATSSMAAKDSSRWTT